MQARYSDTIENEEMFSDDSYNSGRLQQIRPRQARQQQIRPRRARQTQALQLQARRRPARMRSCEEDYSSNSGGGEDDGEEGECKGATKWAYKNYKKKRAELNCKKMHKNNDSTKKTKEYIEKTYYNSTNYTEFDYNLVQVSKFWLDAYESLLNREHDDVIFLSVNFVYCTRNLSEKVFALALLD